MNAMLGKASAGLSILLVLVMLLSIAAPALTAEAPKNQNIVVSSFTNTRGDVSITAGTAEGIKVGQTGTVVRDGKKIADYTVTDVKFGISWVQLSNLAPNETVKVGDSAPLNVTPAAPAPAPAKKKSSKSKILLVAAAIGLAAVLLGGHGGGSSGGGTSLTVDATKTTSEGTTQDTSVVTITATVKDSKGANVADGTPVTFATTLGTLSRNSATTSAGKATATLTAATTESPAVVTVTALGKTTRVTVSFSNSIDLTASQSTIRISSSGGTPTESTITATCRDAQGNLATSGTVTFSTNVGTVSNSSVDIVNGVATTTFTSAAAGDATITAKWSGTTSTIPVKVTAGPPFSITVSSNTTNVLADGNSFATITATVTDLGGNRVSDGTVVKFSVTPDGSGGGNGSITPSAKTSGGQAKATLYSRDSNGVASKSGTAKVTAQVLIADQPSDVPAPASDLTNSSTQINFISTNVAEIHLGASPTNVRGWDMVGNKSTITAVVNNSDHGPVPDGTVVTFRSTHGLISGSGTTSGGIATTTLTTDASGDASWNGLVDVTATAGGVSSTQTGLVVFSGWPSPSKCKATISQATLAKSGGQATIYVEAKDVNGNPIVDGTSITATTSKGTITPSSANTSNGVVMFTLATSTDVANPTEAGAGTVTITIPSGGKNPETGGLPVTLTVDFTVSP